jgi:hypothetical protein
MPVTEAECEWLLGGCHHTRRRLLTICSTSEATRYSQSCGRIKMERKLKKNALRISRVTPPTKHRHKRAAETFRKLQCTVCDVPAARRKRKAALNAIFHYGYEQGRHAYRELATLQKGMALLWHVSWQRHARLDGLPPVRWQSCRPGEVADQEALVM